MGIFCRKDPPGDQFITLISILPILPLCQAMKAFVTIPSHEPLLSLELRRSQSSWTRWRYFELCFLADPLCPSLHHFGAKSDLAQEDGANIVEAGVMREKAQITLYVNAPQLQPLLFPRVSVLLSLDGDWESLKTCSGFAT